MANQFTHKCIVCGKGYNSCFRCKNVESWRNIYCSIQCFQNHMKDTESKPIAEVKEEIRKHQEKLPPIVNDSEKISVKNVGDKKIK